MKLRLRKSPIMALVYGPLIAGAVIAAGFLVMNQPQCPESYTQEQIDMGGCIVGANIGLGLLYFAAPLILIGSTVLTLSFMMAKKKDLIKED